MRTAAQLRAIDDARRLGNLLPYNEKLMDMLPLTDLIFVESAAAIACYDWESAVQKLEVIGCRAMMQNERELALIVAEEVRAAYEKMGLSLHRTSQEALIAIEEGRLDLWLEIGVCG